MTNYYPRIVVIVLSLSQPVVAFFQDVDLWKKDKILELFFLISPESPESELFPLAICSFLLDLSWSRIFFTIWSSRSSCISTCHWSVKNLEFSLWTTRGESLYVLFVVLNLTKSFTRKIWIGTQCDENYGNLLSHIINKNFVKVTLLLKKIL